ncbi:MAG: Hsp70 family protein, partial [Dactylosporangium sp.]|nr:Hsp70 family protein [Dactylosporangium sp.]NNJ61163.1 Hsp70 family protein [Dactylosporangium sp.]
MDPQVRLGIDYGTSNTVAVLHTSGRPARMLLFDGSPQLPSSIFADPDGGFLTGRDAVHSARTDPTRVDPNPKRRINDQFVLLGTVEFPVADLIAATLRRVHGEAERVAGVPVAETVLTYPAAWGPPRRGVLAAAVQRAGLSALSLVPEPVAAAAYFVEVLGARLPLGHCLVVYDFGAGTFDASVVRRVPGGFTVLATEGLPETGGLDVDAAVIEYLGTAGAGWDPALRARLDQPQATDDLRAHGLLWQDARSAKEMLSRASSTFIHVPLVDVDVPLGREQFENLARPILDQTMAATQRAVQAAGVRPDEIAGVFPVGGSSRIPLVATLLHRTFRLAPTVLDQPELVVAEGAALAVPSGGPRPVSGAPVSGTPVSGTPESVSPVSPAATLPLPRLPAPRSGVPAMPPRPVPG